jgi:hypothetical protein
MKVGQVVLRQPDQVAVGLQSLQSIAPQLLLVFASIDMLQAVAAPLAAAFPAAIRVGCSTAGEISAEGVSEQSCVVTALHLAKSSVVESSTRLADMADSQAAGRRLSEQLPVAGLKAVLVFGQGLAVNGSALIQGMAEVLVADITITGGLAGDAAAFKETWVLDHSGAHNDRLVCVGFYGDSLSYSHGSAGGWSPFGPARRVTRSENNVLFELDGESALEVYKRYLGDYAKDLPAAGLLFPFAMLGKDHSEAGLIRTILATDEALGSLTLAGDIDTDGYLRLMHANTDALVEGAEVAAQAATPDDPPAAGQRPGDAAQSLALLVSCVGRKLVMGGRVEEEIEAVAALLGPSALLTGFYSNGEISPLVGTRACKLHNQTMTITRIAEL